MINSITTVLIQCATVLIVFGTREVRKKDIKKKKMEKRSLDSAFTAESKRHLYIAANTLVLALIKGGENPHC